MAAPHPHDATEPCPGGCEDIKTVDQRLDEGDCRMTRIEADLKTTKDGVEELLEILRNAKGFFKVANSFGKVLAWGLSIAAPAYALWYSITGGGPHK